MPAEQNPSAYHGVGAFDLKKAFSLRRGRGHILKYLEMHSQTLPRTMNKVVAITAAMPDGTGLSDFMKAYPKRFIDVGIAEQHAVTMAAGLAAEGIKPVFAVYSTFLQRAYDQIIHDVCIQNLPVVFAIDRAGLVGNDGETHHGVFDLSYLSHIPNMTVLAPKDGHELDRMVRYAVNDHEGPIAIRYPRGKEIFINESNDDIKKPEILKSGKDLTIYQLGKWFRQPLKRQKNLSPWA